MRICFILDYYYPHLGGVEYLFKNLVEGLCREGHEAVVLTRHLPGSPRKETINGVTIYRVRTVNRYLFTLLAIPKALSLARKCDIVHTTTYNAAFPAWIAAKILGKPVVITIHEVWLNKWRLYTDMSRPAAWLHNFLEKMIYCLSFDRYIAISQSTANQLSAIQIPTPRIQAIYHGFDHEYFNPDLYDAERIRKKYALGSSFVCFAWGRPGVSKGHEYLIRAVPRIIEKIPRARILLMLSGEDTYRNRYEYLKNMIEKLDLAEGIALVDPAPRNELGDYLKAADCIIIPSLAEGFGYAVLEACAMRKPVVASNTTSIPEVIHGRYVLVEPKNPDAIANGVERVSRGEYDTSGAKVFTWSKTIADCIEVYTALQRGKGFRSP